MANDSSSPQSLLQATRYFADPDICVDFVAAMRWPDGVTCPHCEGKQSFLPVISPHLEVHGERVPQAIQREDSSVFEDSPIPLDKWLAASWLVVNCKNGVSSYETRHRFEDHPEECMVCSASRSPCAADSGLGQRRRFDWRPGRGR